MAPKRTRAQPASSTQPTEQRQTRAAGRKRRASDVSEPVSDRPSSSQSMNAPSMASTPAKRRKKTRTVASVEPEMIVEEEEEEVEHVLHGPTCDATTSDAVEKVTETTHRVVKEVQFPSGRQSQTVALNDDDEVDRTTAFHITPHPRKMSVKRRITASPGVNGEGERRQKITSTRHSLPPALLPNGELYYTVDQHNMAPLSAVLSERIQHRMQIHARRNARIKDLEAQRPLLEGNELETLDAELVELREEQQHTFDALTTHDDDDELDPDMLVLESQHELAYADAPNDSTLLASSQVKLRQSFSQSSSQRSKEQDWEAERENFRSAIVTLSNQANDARTKLQILEIELRALGFGDHEDARAILLSIRESFMAVRGGLEIALPDSVPEDASNGDVLEILLADVQEFASRLRTQDKELFEKSNLATSLGTQVDRLLDHLAEAKIENERLLELQGELEQQKLGNEEENLDLKAEVDQIADERDVLEDELEAALKRIKEFEVTYAELTSTIEKLSASLTKYKVDEQRLTDLITRMEEEHATNVLSMKTEHDEAVRGLEVQIGEQTQLHEEAERLAAERQTMISGLGEQKVMLEEQRDTLQQELEAMTKQRDAERGAREDAEIDLRERNVEVENLEERVDRLEQQLGDLNDQINELRELNDSERADREAAEAKVETAQEEIAALTTKLQESGAQANELRQKLWQVQQTNEKEVRELRELASERDQQYQADIKEEIDRREVVEGDLQDREDAIEDLKAQLADLENQMADTLAERDDRISSLEQEVADKTAEVEELKADLQSTQNLYEAQIARNKDDREEFEHSIAALQETIATHEDQIATLQQDTVDESALHASEIEDRNSRIAQLNHEVAELTDQVRELKADKASLERRVEQEAEQMLHVQAEMGDEIEGLKAVVADKQAKIAVVEQKAVEADERWQDVLQAREEDIRALQEQTEISEETITSLTTQNETIRHKFAEYVRRTNAKMRALRDESDRARARIDEQAEETMKDGEAQMLDLEAMDTVSALVTKTTTRTIVNGAAPVEQSASHSKVGRLRKKRVKDSGIGLDESDSILSA
ncbi:hypothetical protein CERZMDRAFT_99100 [Cercospora zeae-maydis SCOH1-5]|uniref:Uncharacterized protein n=1 Tax=Cercospora zeae-maydis SCOH1-5 TaxID=717836 RepID=A0A6A6FBS8_9PEZI|nr:hypothetical protein CERZMDRAFT_99100 [Cercospora zeae-maydis SCOH1-5]